MDSGEEAIGILEEFWNSIEPRELKEKFGEILYFPPEEIRIEDLKDILEVLIKPKSSPPLSLFVTNTPDLPPGYVRLVARIGTQRDLITCPIRRNNQCFEFRGTDPKGNELIFYACTSRIPGKANKFCFISFVKIGKDFYLLDKTLFFRNLFSIFGRKDLAKKYLSLYNSSLEELIGRYGYLASISREISEGSLTEIWEKYQKISISPSYGNLVRKVEELLGKEGSRNLVRIMEESGIRDGMIINVLLNVPNFLIQSEEGFLSFIPRNIPDHFVQTFFRTMIEIGALVLRLKSKKPLEEVYICNLPTGSYLATPDRNSEIFVLCMETPYYYITALLERDEIGWRAITSFDIVGWVLDEIGSKVDPRRFLEDIAHPLQKMAYRLPRKERKINYLA